MFSLSFNSALLASAGVHRCWVLAAQWRLHRPERTLVLLAVVLGLSMFDLGMTVHEVSTSGMFEDNPLARLFLGLTGHPASLGALKALSLVVSMGLLMHLRCHWQAEIGAWVAVAILLWLTARWAMYLAVVWEAQPNAFADVGFSDHFVTLE
jgi:hypothetical protein